MMHRRFRMSVPLVVAAILIAVGVVDLVGGNLMGVIPILLGVVAVTFAVKSGRTPAPSSEHVTKNSRIWVRAQERGFIATAFGLIGIILAILSRNDLVVALLIFLAALPFLVAGFLTLIGTRGS